jgi:diguanylate cyclase (GGDEF)-like protein
VTAIGLIQYTAGVPVSPAQVMLHFPAAVMKTKEDRSYTMKVFNPYELDESLTPQAVHWVAEQMMDRIAYLGKVLDETYQLAYTDPVSGLPNSISAAVELETALENPKPDAHPVCVLFIDGDDLRDYNKISYAAGDEMIFRLSQVLKGQLRDGDVLARWRIGDEFLVILPATSLEMALVTGERLRAAVEKESAHWQLPVTISVGAACHPQHGRTPELLLNSVERANSAAKRNGKNRVVSAGEI